MGGFLSLGSLEDKEGRDCVDFAPTWSGDGQSQHCAVSGALDSQYLLLDGMDE